MPTKEKSIFLIMCNNFQSYKWFSSNFSSSGILTMVAEICEKLEVKVPKNSKRIFLFMSKEQKLSGM